MYRIARRTALEVWPELESMTSDLATEGVQQHFADRSMYLESSEGSDGVRNCVLNQFGILRRIGKYRYGGPSDPA